jgi:GNAT superfamily N-acetyltransferase
MACLIAVRGITSGYINLAEELNWNYAKNKDGEEDTIIGSRYGEELIGACILRLERNGSGKKARKLGGKGIVRAWTVRIKYRGRGVGTELLEEAVRVTREKLGGSAEIGFAAEHANSKMVLPELFNGGFRKREAKAAKLLDGVVGSFEWKKKR